jgi:threonine dehydratase
MNTPEPTFQDVTAAARRLAGHANVTPLLEAPVLNERVGGRVFLKAENLQLAGAFKYRGAYNRLSQLSPEQRAAGVVAFSSGNHAQGVALAARELGIDATIVMPSDAPAIKLANTRRLGASLVIYDRKTEDREAIARRLSTERGATLVPAYDDPHIIAGQGTLALEAMQQLKDRTDETADAFLTPCGGGGLIAGCALAVNALSPTTRLHSVEPANFDDMARSLASGKHERNNPNATTICDALMPTTPGNITFAIARRLLAGGLVVTDEMALAAIEFAWRELKLVVEPGGAVALAAVLNGVLDCRGKLVVVVLSGGNVDPDTYRAALSRSN